MKIIVTEEHIKHGVPGSCRYCPLALALQDSTGDEFAFAGVEAKVHNGWYSFPESALEFQERFDAGVPVSPFEFFIAYGEAV